MENIFPADPGYHQKISFNGGMAKSMGSFVDPMGLSPSLGPWEANGGRQEDRYSSPEPFPELLYTAHL